MPRPRRLLPVVLVVLLVITAVGGLLVDRLLEFALRRPVNAYLRGRTLELVRAAEDGTLDIAVPTANLHLLDRTVDLEGIRIRYERAEGAQIRRLEARSTRVRLTGVVIWDIVRGRDFRLTGAEITAPVILIDDVLLAGPADTAAAAPEPPDSDIPTDLPAPDSLLFTTVRSWLPEDMHGARIERLRVLGGVVAHRNVQGGHMTTDSITGIDLDLRGVSVDSLQQRVFARASIRVANAIHAGPTPRDSLIGDSLALDVGADDTVLAIARARTGAVPGTHQLIVHGLRRSQAHRTLSVDTITWAPAEPDSLFFRTAAPRSTRVRVSAAGITVMGLPAESVRRRRLLAGGVWIAGLDLDVLADRRIDGTPSRRVLWPARFATLDWRLGADSITVADGRIRYAELLPDARRAGEVHFDGLAAQVRNATNDPERTPAPLVLEAKARLYGLAPLTVRIAVPVRTGPLRATVEGGTGSMPLVTFNRFLRPADGLTVSGGTLREAEFRFTIVDGRARGRFAAAWDSLGLRKADQHTGHQSLGDRLVTMFANAMTRESSRRARDGSLEGARIRYRVLPTDTFWGALWRALRSGIITAVRE